MSFNSLAELRGSRSTFDTLVKEVEKISNSQFSNNEDTRFWQPEVDKVGNGYAVIRFLPAPKGEDMPWVRIFHHGFDGPTGRWYIENSLTTLNKPDPVSELNAELWKTGLDSDKDTVRKQKRRLTYTSNILVVNDPAHPENNGKVKLFKFGKKIFDKITDVMKPQFPGEEPINPFDFWKGANFELKIRKIEGFRNYDKSEFKDPTPISNDDNVIEAIWNQQSSLLEFLDAKNFKTYEELKAHLQKVLAGSSSKVKAENVDLSAPAYTPAPAPAPMPDETEDESLSYFANLANDE